MARAAERFSTAADTYAATFAACECAPQPDEADDGSRPIGSAFEPAVTCGGHCATTNIID